METPGATLAALGWNERIADLVAATHRAGASAGRVTRVDRGEATVATESGSVRAATAGTGVTTGDWVVLGDADGQLVVAVVLDRASAFVRGDPMDGWARDAQVVAANVDAVFVVQALNNGPNLRRLERELVLTYDSGAEPVVVLSKADLVTTDAASDALGQVRRVAPAVEAIVTSAVTGEGLESLRSHVAPGRTVALIGASGVGKSTLVNRLAGDDVQATGRVRARDQRGRHTTTARELILLPGGGVLLDTPGLRAVALWDGDEGLSRVFGDVEALASQCRFADCAHDTEPGCAVRAAVERGELDADRVAHYLQLDRELDEVASRASASGRRSERRARR